jgi:hypothetical protein
MDKTRSFLSFLHVIHGVFGPQTGPFPSIVSFANKVFEGEWEQITSWLLANLERSSGEIFRELQRLSPGRRQPLQICTFQRGMRKIRAHSARKPLRNGGKLK